MIDSIRIVSKEDPEYEKDDLEDYEFECLFCDSQNFDEEEDN
jgi:hypothetical protein